MRIEASASWPGHPPGRTVRRLRRTVLVALLAIVVAGVSYHYSLRSEFAGLQADSSHRLELFATAVGGIVQRLEHVPATVQLNPEVLSLIREPGDARHVLAVNRYLRSLNAHVGGMAIFVMNARGITLASSNFDQVGESFVGEDLSFRPYFLDALSGRVGRHFAIGTTRGDPGYYVSHPIRDGARLIGVAVIKISLKAVEDAWGMLGVPALIADSNQVVILSSEPAWRYTALQAMPLEQQVDAQLARLYNNRPIAAFPMKLPVASEPGEHEVIVERPPRAASTGVRSRASTDFLLQQRVLDGIGWRLYIFSDLRQVRHQALLQALLAATVVVLLVLFFTQRRRILRQKFDAKRLLERANLELEQKVARRTRALTDTNNRLRKEVSEREHAEQTLRAAQDELVQAAKLAVIGQLAAGITHELAQPLSAIRTLAGNAQEFLRRGQEEAAMGNLDIMNRLTEQMGDIIQPLKGFARKSPSVPARIDVSHALTNALFLLDTRLREAAVTVVHEPAPDAAGQSLPSVMAWCDQNRLEQVLVNLIGNAIDAMADQEAPRVLSLRSRVLAASGRVTIEVCDTGPGVNLALRERVFEPFFTTKPAGVGLGLGLAISRDIAREFGGDLTLEARPAVSGAAGDENTCFTVWLPVPPSSPVPD